MTHQADVMCQDCVSLNRYITVVTVLRVLLGRFQLPVELVTISLFMNKNVRLDQVLGL